MIAEVAQIESGDATRTAYQQRARVAYDLFAGRYRKRFKWLRPTLVHPRLKKKLREDIDLLMEVLHDLGTWDAADDTKLVALYDLIAAQHPGEKVLVFSQFADTVRYLDGLTERCGRRSDGRRHRAIQMTRPRWRGVSARSAITRHSHRKTNCAS